MKRHGRELKRSQSLMQTNLVEDLHRLEVETFEIEEIGNVGIDAPVVIVDDGSGEGGGELMSWSSSSCSTSSCCSCSTSSCCSTSTSTSSCG